MGGGGGGGGQQWGGGNSGGVFNLSSALHTISISLQNSLSWKALRALIAFHFNASWVKSVRRKIGQAKNRIKKTDRTNIIATNFVESN